MGSDCSIFRAKFKINLAPLAWTGIITPKSKSSLMPTLIPWANLLVRLAFRCISPSSLIFCLTSLKCSFTGTRMKVCDLFPSSRGSLHTGNHLLQDWFDKVLNQSFDDTNLQPTYPFGQLFSFFTLTCNLLHLLGHMSSLLTTTWGIGAGGYSLSVNSLEVRWSLGSASPDNHTIEGKIFSCPSPLWAPFLYHPEVS